MLQNVDFHCFRIMRDRPLASSDSSRNIKSRCHVYCSVSRKTDTPIRNSTGAQRYRRWVNVHVTLGLPGLRGYNTSVLLIVKHNVANLQYWYLVLDHEDVIHTVVDLKSKKSIALA
jgi:hypothetical protein